jgi:hypothetical protein
LFARILFLSSLSLPFFPILFHLISYTSFSSVPLHCHLSLPVPASYSVSSVFPSLLFCFLSVYFLPVPSPKSIPLSLHSPDSFRYLPIHVSLPDLSNLFVFLLSFLFPFHLPLFLFCNSSFFLLPSNSPVSTLLIFFSLSVHPFLFLLASIFFDFTFLYSFSLSFYIHSHLACPSSLFIITSLGSASNRSTVIHRAVLLLNSVLQTQLLVYACTYICSCEYK